MHPSCSALPCSFAGNAKNPPLSLRFDPSESDPHCIRILVGIGRAQEKHLWFRSETIPLDRNGAVLLCLGLLPAMEVNAPLHIDEPLPCKLVESLPSIRQLITEWYPGTSPTPIFCPATKTVTSHTGRKTALCFSAGVDSSYSLAIEQNRIDTLITLIGADVPVTDSLRAERLRHAADAVAKAFGKNLIVIETNVREIFDRWIGWVEYHGAVLAAVGHMLQHEVKHLLIASSADESSWQRPCGTHPALDHLWGSESLRIEHHAMAPRFSKVARLIPETSLMEQLRVCDRDDHHCGRCPDCQFMHHSLDVLQAFSYARTYPQGQVPMRRIAIGLEEYGTHNDYLDLRATAMTTQRHAKLVKRIDRALRMFWVKDALAKTLAILSWQRRFKRFKRRYRYKKSSQ